MASKKPRGPQPRNYAERRARQQKSKAEQRNQRQARKRRVAERRKHHSEHPPQRRRAHQHPDPEDFVRLAPLLKRPPRPAQLLDAYLSRQVPDDPRVSAYLTAFRRIIGTPSCDRPAEVERFRVLVRTLQRRMPKLLCPNLIVLLGELDRLPWLRPLSGWTPRRSAPATRLGELIAHALSRYPLPPVLLGEVVALSQQGTDLSPQQRSLLRERLQMIAALGDGAGMRALQDRGLLPASLTRRMLHDLAHHQGATTLLEATRSVQVSAYGGSPGLARVIGRTFLGRLQDDEAFWAVVIHWLCRHEAEVAPRQVGPLLDHIGALSREAAGAGREWSIASRSPAALLRSMERWHTALRALRSARVRRFVRSGLKGILHTRNRSGTAETWTVGEIRTTEELAREGRDLHHCVASYAHNIRDGRCTIWSMKCNGERVLTIEVADGTVVQARGRANRPPRKPERAVLAQWADLNRLAVRLG